MTSLLGAGAGVLGLELDGLGGVERNTPSFTELFLLFWLPPPGAKAGRLPCDMELVSEFCPLVSCKPVYSSPKKPPKFFRNLPLTLLFEPVDDAVVALATDGLRLSPSFGKAMPFGGAKPGDIWPRFSAESL